ncbi:sugar phosphate isomerase/epimerase family protein [Devosia sp. SL43]|uniref:sugar phosphate isomerase/epimerase family protein n=1 Tax=Devosia sp. SL43 TaxID=2806348 RepID=UPI001F16401F|nr:sugar phosphate isomerase/epimerase [Devosia sp. SL43]UJW86527.1 sugar phosphate isomerase/epimerase [Devosia sp. SL43]
MTRKMAYNPLSFYFTPEGFRSDAAPPLTEILSVVRDTGYDGIHSAIPVGSTPQDYLALLKQYDLVPAPGYFQASFADTEKLPDTINTARRLAGDHARLGLDRVFIAEAFGVAPERTEKPGLGVGGSEERLSRIVEGLAKVASAMVSEGIVPCLHPHIGTRIETGDEADFILNRISAKDLLVGPDTGHLSWAGADLTDFILRHSGRIGAVHIKDYRKPVADQGMTYTAANKASIWTEPGRGSIDLEGAIKALGSFEGWFVVEVDIADQPTVPESARVAAEWLRPRLSLGRQ